MHQFIPRRSGTVRFFIACLIAFTLFTTPLASLAASRKQVVFKTSPPASPPAKSSDATAVSSSASNVSAINALLVPTITASKVDALFTDVNGDTNVDPGDTLEYTVTIQNTGTDATGVTFTDTIDSHTTLFGAVNTSPIAFDDPSYTATGNVQITISAPGVLANDIDPDTGTNAALTASAGATSANGGNVTMNANGGFTYNPAPGFTGTDTFTYTVTDASGATGTGTVTFNVTGMIWFVNSALGANGDGRLSSPFNCLVGAGCYNTSANDPGDNIFLYSSGTAYNGGLVLKNNQRLIGGGASASLSAITGLTPPAGSLALPSTGGAHPTVTTAVAATDSITLAQGNTLRGFNITNSTDSDIAGNNFGTASITEMTLSGTGRALDLINGTLSSSSLTSVTVDTSATQGISLQQVAGSLTIGSTTVTSSTTQGILVSQSTATIAFGNTLVGNNTVAVEPTIGVSLQSNSAGTRSFGTLTILNTSATAFVHATAGGATTVSGLTTITNPTLGGIDIQDSTTAISFQNANITQSGGTGVFIDDSTGAVSFADLDINPDGGQRGLHITDHSTGTITTTSGTITTTTGTGVEITGAGTTPLGMVLTQVTVNGAPSGIVIQNNSGSFSVIGDNTNARNGSGGTFTNTTSDGVRLSNGNNITLKSININSPGDTIDPDIADNESTVGEHGVEAIAGSNIILSGILIDSPSASGMVARDLTGTSRINNNSLITNIDNPATHGLYIRNDTGNLTLFEVNDTDFTNSSSGAATVNFLNSGSSNMTVEIRNGCVFEALSSQAITGDAGALAGTTGTVTSLITGNTFQNAVAHTPSPGVNVTYENNVAALVANSATHNATITNNTFSNIAEDGRVANTSIIRTQNAGGKLTAIVENNTIQNINYQASAGGRHVIGHVFEPISYNAANFSNLRFNNNTATNITFTATNREFVFIDYRDNAGNGDIKINGNNWNMPTGAATSEAMDLNFQQLNASTIDLEVDGNGLGTGATSNTSTRFLRIDSEDAATVNATVTDNVFTNLNGAPGIAIDFSTIDSVAGAPTPTMCVNVSNNNVTAAGNQIRLNEAAGTMNVTQTSAANVTAVNNGAAVTVVGTPAFAQPACTLPTVFMPRSNRMNDALATVTAQKDLSSVVATVSAPEVALPASMVPVQSEANVTKAVRRHSHHAVSKIKRAYQAVTNLVAGPAPMMLAGETVTVNGSGSGFTLPQNKTITIKFRVTVNDPPNLTLLNPARVSNQGTVAATGISNVLTDDPAVGGASDPTETLIDLYDSQTSVGTSGSPSIQGNSVTFTATVTPVSSGPTPVTGTVDFFDGTAIPANLIAGCDDRPLSGSPAQATCTTSALTAAGSPHTITARYNADGGNYDASSGTVSQTVILVPDLTIDKSHTGTFFQGQTGATYTITVTNSGNGAMPTGQSISVTDTLPDGLTATAMSGTGWTCAPTAPPNTFPVSGPTTISCARSGDTLLAAAASYPNITLTVNVDNDAPTGNPALSNDVSVTSGVGGEVNTGNNSDTDPTAINAGVDLTIDKSHTDIFTQGDTGKTYTITVTNSGGTASSGTVTVTDTLPTGLTPTAPNGAHNGWTCGIVGQVLTCTRGDALSAAASYPSITLTVDVLNNAPTSVDNTATVSGGGDINGANNSDTDQTTINQLCVVPPANMVAWWSGDNTARDIAGGNDGTLNGNASYAAGKVLNGFNLDGTGDFVQAPDSNSLDVTAAITIDAWVNPTNATPTASLVDKISVGGTDGYSLDLVNGNLRFRFGSQSAQSTGVVPNGTFTHVAVTYDGANVSFYVNGVLDSTTALTGAIPVNALPLRIGAAQDGSLGFAGVIDEVEIFSAALPVADILAIHNATSGKCKPSDLRITKTHSGNFYLNQTGATYTITVTNDGPGDTSGTVTVTDTLPAGLTATGFTGTNWTCQALPALSCSRSDVLASGGAYENIILTVNVDSGAPTGPNAVTNTVTLSGGGGLDTSDDTANDPTQINTLPDNIAPVNTVPGAQVTNEDVAIVFTGGTQISIADADAGSATVQVSLTATFGVISLSGTTGLNFACGGCSGDGISDASMVFQGTITDINNALNNLTFTPTANYNGPASLQIVTDDLGNTGFGGSQSDTDTINITVNSVNDPPSFTLAGDPPSVNVDAGAQTVNNFATGISAGPGESQTLTFNVSPTGTTGTLTFSTAPAIDSTTGALTYTATNGTNGTASFSVTLSDNGSNTPPNSNTSGAQTFTITVLVNATPVVTTTGGNLAYTEGDPATAIDPGLTVTDTDNTDLTGATVSITAGFVSAQDTLAFTNQLGITGNYNSGTGVLTLTGTTTLANYQTALRTVTYQNSSDAPTSSRTITFGATDGITTGSATRGITITAVNDGPVNTIPPAQTTTEDTAKVFSSGNGNQISVADVDAGSNPIKITLTATNGTVTLSGTAGLTFTPPADGTDDATMVFTGTLTAVNTALNGMSFNPTPNFNGAASLQIVSDDQGNTGTGGPLTDTDTVNITVTAANDNPVVTATAGNLSYTEGDPATAIDPGLTVTDVDNANLTGATVAITANFASTEDVLAFTNQLGITGNYNSGTGVLTLTGATTVANYQTALRSVTYQNNSENPSTSVRTVTFTANDGSLTGSATRGIAVTSVNDAPVNTVPGAQQILVDATLTFSGGSQVSVADVDAGGNTIQVALTATNGTITLASTTGLSFSFTDANGTGAGDGTADATMTFRGTIANINAALNGMTFTPTSGFSGSASVQITTNDLGNTGSGGPQVDTDTVNISVVATLALTVNTTGDQADANLGDRICDVDLGTGGDQCTLRAAIQETNASATADTIGFSLPASSTIELTSALPAIAGDLEINGPTNKLTIDGNSTGRVFEVTSGTVSIDPLTITGGLVNGGHGAGLLVTGGDVTVKDLLFTANTAINGNGGAIAVTGGLLTILNTTISGNTATNAGGVYLGAGGLTMINVTVTNNTANGDTGSGPTATGDGGGLAVGGNPSFIRNSIIAGNTATTNTNVSGSIGLGGNNLVAGDPRLAPLADNGGPTMTHALLAGSPALDAGDNNQATTAGLVNDQRGFDRITDGNGDAVDTVDIGAFEAQVFVEDIADRAINEDGSDSFSFNVGGAAAITSVTATSSNTALVPNSTANLDVTGAGGTRTLTITPVVNGFGTTTITVTVMSASGSMSDTFLFTVNPVNDPPVFTGGPNVVVSEDAGPQTIPGWATGISPGPANESTQTLTFLVSNGNNALFSVQPAISTNGTLTFTPAANATGVATVSVQLQDNGGGTDTTPFPPYQFTITVNAVNDPPTFTGGPNQTVNEDAGPQSVPNWATGISPGPADESGQTLTFLVSNGNNALFSVQPAIAADGTLTYTPAANASGIATVSVQLQDNGGGTDSSPFPPYQFTITVNAVNDAPSFTKGANQTVNEDAGAQSVPNWATAISAGPADESGQTVAFNVTNDNNALFSVQPAVSPTGTLTYTPAPDANGTATVSVSLTDNGGTANGGQNTSAVQTFTITVNAVNDGPVNTVPAAQSVTENSTLTFSAGNGNQISIADVDAGAPGVQVTLTAANGTVTLSGTAGLAFSVGDGTADATMTFTGTVASINTALNGLVFTPTNGFSGAASLQIVTNDLGNTGSGGALSDTDTVNITVNDGGTLQFDSATYSVNESAGTATITVTRTGGTAGTTTVDFTTSNGTATAGVSDDYLTSSGTLTFGPGVTSQTFTVTINNDPNNEPNETINLTLSNVTGSGSLGTPSAAVLTIVDNDPGGSLQFSSATYSVSESGGSITITVERVGGSAGTAFVDFATSNGTATAGVGQDYTATSGTLTFGNGVTSQTFSVPILNDAVNEPSETVNLTLSNVLGTGQLGIPSTAVLTITDDDIGFGLSASSYTVGEGSVNLAITVNRLGDTTLPASVEYSTSDLSAGLRCEQFTGVASERCDYSARIGVLSFAAGQSSAVINIPIVDDVHVEGPETFNITLSNPIGAVLGTPLTAVITITDNDTVFTQANPIDTFPFYVRMQYLDFLEREPDAIGFAYWLDRLNTCAANPACNLVQERIQVSAGFFYSNEFLLRKGYFIYRFYRASLGRAPTYHEFVKDMAAIGAVDADENARRAAFTLNWVTRPDFMAIYNGLSDADFVDQLVNTAGVNLNRPQLVAELQGGKSRAQLVRDVAENVLVYDKYFREAFVTTQYFGYLKRDPDAIGFAYWMARVNLHPNDFRLEQHPEVVYEVVGGFIYSEEYQLRFGNRNY